jgi:integrase/recombinase XerD
MVGVDPIVIERLGPEHPLTRHLGDFLTDLSNAGAPANTVRAYRGDHRLRRPPP